IVPVFLKELICKVHGPLAPLLELSRFEILLGELGVGQVSVSHFDIVRGMTNYRYWLLIAPSSWSFVSAVSSQMTYLVASITLDSAKSYVMQGAFLTQGMISNIPIVFSWGGSICPKGFLSFVLLWLVIIVAIVGVSVTVVVVVKSSSVVKLSFVIT
ncbi:hypothetical protein Tco_0866120, partial [Tanacetum coccineum]